MEVWRKNWDINVYKCERLSQLLKEHVHTWWFCASWRPCWDWDNKTPLIFFTLKTCSLITFHFVQWLFPPLTAAEGRPCVDCIHKQKHPCRTSLFSRHLEVASKFCAECTNAKWISVKIKRQIKCRQYQWLNGGKNCIRTQSGFNLDTCHMTTRCARTHTHTQEWTGRSVRSVSQWKLCDRKMWTLRWATASVATYPQSILMRRCLKRASDQNTLPHTGHMTILCVHFTCKPISVFWWET